MNLTKYKFKKGLKLNGENLENKSNFKKLNLRNYDENPIVIGDFSVFSLFYLFWFLSLFGLLFFAYIVIFADNFTNRNIFGLFIAVYLVFVSIKNFITMKEYKQQNKSYFSFTKQSITSTRDYIISDLFSKNKYISENKTIPNPVLNLEKVYFCVVCELQSNYGRFHYFTPYELYKKSSIGVHIGKIVLYMRHFILYMLFALPYKFYKLKKANEPLWLLKKNFVIRCKNRNYLLVNVYSTKEYNELLQYFQSLNIEIENKTKFIPHIQNDGWFQDKNEIWSDDFSDTEIPKDTFKKKLRRFFSLD